MIRKLEADSSTKIQSVHRALRLLKLITAKGSISASEAAANLDVHASSAQRILATLVLDGFAVQDDHRRYSAGPEFLNAGRLATTVPLTVRTRPALSRLHSRVRETVHFVTLIGTNIHHIDGILDTSHTLRFGGRVGVVLPAHVTSSGRAIMAQMDRSDLEQRYLSDPDNSAGIATAREMEPIHKLCAKTRQHGMGMNFGDSEEGVAAFGMSIGFVEGQHVGFSIAMPSARFSDKLIPAFRTALSAAVSEALAALDLPTNEDRRLPKGDSDRASTCATDPGISTTTG